MRRITTGVVLIAVSLATPVFAVAGQRKAPSVTRLKVAPARPTVEQLNEQNRKTNLLNAAAQAYRRGERDAALGLLDLVPYDEQLGFVQGILWELRQQREQRKSGKPTFTPSDAPQATVERVEWSVPLVRALGALEMEAVLRAYNNRMKGGVPAVYPQANQDAGEALFGFVEEERGEKYWGTRWELALALTMLADGELAWTRAVLSTPCRDTDNDTELLLACGTADEVFTMQPAHLIMGPIRSSQPPPVPRMGVPINHDRSLSEIAELNVGTKTPIPHQVRESYLTRASEALQSLLRISPHNPEATLRLAHIRILQGKDDAAAPLLQQLLSRGSDIDVRVRYMAGLFLADIRQRTGQPQASASLLQEALTLVPAGQSALVALADVQRALGDVEGMNATVQRLLSLAERDVDPWWEYSMGQYWASDPLLAQLRANARQ
jgi:hypothetical protein